MGSKLVAMSFDTLASPSVAIKPLRPARVAPASWGLAWYPDDHAAANVQKDPADRRDVSVDKVLRQWERLRSTVIVMHTRSTAKRATQQDTQPLVRIYRRRDLLFAHCGDLNDGWEEKLALGDDPVYEPLGRTDSEHVFCWLLENLRKKRARTLAGAGWDAVHGWLQEIDSYGRINLILTDGINVLAYRDSDDDRSLYLIRRPPPASEGPLVSDELEITLEDGRDSLRSQIVISSEPLSGEAWTKLQPGQMVVVRRASVEWSSHEMGECETTSGFEPESPLAVSPSTVDDPAPLQGQVSTSIPQSFTANVAPIRIHAITAEGGRELTVVHETHYRYDNPVERSAHLIRLQPIQDPRQDLLDFELNISPYGQRRQFEDVFGNRAIQLMLSEPYNEFSVAMAAHVRIQHESIEEIAHERVTIPLVWMPWQRQMMHAYLLPAELAETQLQELSEFAMSFVERQGYDLIEALRDMNRVIYNDFQYVSGSTTLETTPFEVYSSRRGVCQDFANLFICLARLLGVPARYRVGYIFTGGDYENKIQSDASHAWAEVYLPQIGWHGFDPTNGCEAGLDHIRVASGRNYRDATPTTGTIYKGGGAEMLNIKVEVREAATVPV